MKLSQRILGIKPSATLAVDAKAKELKSQGKDVISFGSGEPDFVSPEAAIEYAKEAMDKGETHYTPTPGILELRQEICLYYKKRFGLDYHPSQVVVGSGAKPCIYEALAAIIDPGDEVVLLAPAWVSYIEQVHLLDGKTVVVDTENNGFVPSLDKIEEAITEKTVALLMNSPSNPTGVMFDEETINGIGRIALKYDLWLIWDEIYEQLTYDEACHYNPVQLLPEIGSRTIIINGVSKAYAMTGWRIGYLLASKELVAKIIDFQSHLTSNACSIAQWAAVGAMRKSDRDVVMMKEAFGMRREIICSLLRDMPYISFALPQGAFYIFVNIKECMGKRLEGLSIDNDIVFCNALLDDQLVAVVPGSAFMTPGYLRLSYAASPEVIIEGMSRLRIFLEKLN